MFEQFEALSRNTFINRAIGLAGLSANRLLPGAQTFDSDVQSVEKSANFSGRLGSDTRTGVPVNWPFGLLGKSYNNLSTLREQRLRCLSRCRFDQSIVRLFLRTIPRSLLTSGMYNYFSLYIEDYPEIINI